MADQCKIKSTANKVFESKSTTLKLLGINNEEQFKNLLSLFLKQEQYAMYIGQSNGTESTSSDTTESIVSDSNITNKTTKAIDSGSDVQSDANKIITGQPVEKVEANEKEINKEIGKTVGETVETIESGIDTKTSEPEISVTESTEDVADIESAVELQLDKVELLNDTSSEVNNDVETFSDTNTVESFEEATSDKQEELKSKKAEIIAEKKVLLDKLESIKVNTYEELIAMSDEELNAKISEELELITASEKILKAGVVYAKYSGKKDNTAMDIYKTISSNIEAIERIINNSVAKYISKNREKREELNKNIEDVNNTYLDKQDAEDQVFSMTRFFKEQMLNRKEKLDSFINPLKDSIEDIEIMRNSIDEMKSNIASSKRVLDRKQVEELINDTSATGYTNVLKYIDRLNAIYDEQLKSKLEFTSEQYTEIKKLQALIGNEKYLLEMYKAYKEDRPNSKATDFNLFYNQTIAGSNKYYYETINPSIKYYLNKSEDEKALVSLKLDPSYVIGSKAIIRQSDFEINKFKSNAKSLFKGDEVYANRAYIANAVYNILRTKGKSFQKRYLEKDGASADSRMNDLAKVFSYIEKPSTFIGKDIEPVKNEIDFLANRNNFDFFEGLVNLQSNNSFIDDQLPGIFETVGIDEKDETEIGSEVSISSDYKYNSLIGELIGYTLITPKNGDTPYYLVNVENKSSVDSVIKIQSIAVLGEILKMADTRVNDDNFDSVWGIDRNNFSGDISYLAELAIEGNIPQATIVKKLGNAIYNDLGIKFNKNNSADKISKLKTELGLYSVLAMQKKGLLSDGGIVNVGTADKPKNQRLIRINNMHSESQTAKEIKAEFESNPNKEYSEIYFRDEIEVMSKLLSHLYDLDDRPKPMLVKPEPKFDRIVRNSFVKVSQDTNRIINDYETTGQKFNSLANDIYELWKIDKNAAYGFVGIGELNDIDGKSKNYNGNKHNIEDAEAQASKYNNERLELDALMSFYEDNMFDDNGIRKNYDSFEFYLPWDFTVSGRYMTDSNINPQNSKITRFVVQSDQMKSSMEYIDGKFSEEDLNSLKVGLAQALDFGIDKQTDATSFNAMNKEFTIALDGTVEFVNENSKYAQGFNYFKALIGGDDTYIDRLAKEMNIEKDSVGKVIASKFVLKDFGSMVKKGEGVHGLAAMKLLAEIDNFKNKDEKDKLVFTHTFTSESDDITSGMILTLMNIGTQEARMLLEKGGVYTKEAIKFWKKAITDVYNSETYKLLSSEDKKKFPIPLKDKDGEYRLTHGFLAEFGKALDSQSIRESLFDELSRLGYDNDVLGNRLWFKDFYTTVARNAKIAIQYIKEDTDSYFETLEPGMLLDLTSEETLSKSVSDLLNSSKEDGYLSDNDDLLKKNISRQINNYMDDTVMDEVFSILSTGKSMLSYVFDNTVDRENKIVGISSDDIRNLINDEEGRYNKLVGNGNKLPILSKSFAQFVSGDTRTDKNTGKVSIKQMDDFVKMEFLKKHAPEFYKEITSGAKEQKLDIGTPSYSKLINSVMKDFNASTNKSDTAANLNRAYKKIFVKKMNDYLFNDFVSSIAKIDKTSEQLKNPSFKKFHNLTLVLKGYKDGIKVYNDEMQKSLEYNKMLKNKDAINIIDVYKQKVLERSLITLGGDEISRSLAKNPVMVFIYGSSLGSIKKLIKNTIAKESVYNDIIARKDIAYNKDIDTESVDKGELVNARNAVEHTFERIEPSNRNFAFKYIMNEITGGDISSIDPGSSVLSKVNKDYMKDYAIKSINKENGLVEFAEPEKRLEMLDKGDYSGLVINSDMANALTYASNNTYGKSFESSFSTLFGDVTKYRESIKSLEIVRYTIHKFKIDKAINELIKEKFGDSDIKDGSELKLTANDIAWIKKKLEEQGFGHSVEDSNGARQSLYKSEQDSTTGGQVKVKLVGKEYSVRGASYESVSEVENTGAAPVTTIHQYDGRKIGVSLEGTGALNIYDALVYGANNLDSMVSKMNESFIDVLGSHSALKTSLSEIETMILKLGDIEINEMLELISDGKMKGDFINIISNGMKKIDRSYDILKTYSKFDRTLNARIEQYAYDVDTHSEILSNDSNMIVNSLSYSSEEILVRHNSLSDNESAEAKGTAFQFNYNIVDTDKVFELFNKIINAARGTYSEYKYLDAVSKSSRNIEIEDNVFDTELKKLESLLSSVGYKMYDEKGTKVENDIIKKFRDCLGK